MIHIHKYLFNCQHIQLTTFSILYFSISLDSLCGLIACSSLCGEVPTHNRVYRGTSLCPYLVLSFCLILLPLFFTSPSASPSPSGYPAIAGSASSHAPSKSYPSCSHHLLETRVPGLRIAYSHMFRIGRVAIYCANLFCLHVI